MNNKNWVPKICTVCGNTFFIRRCWVRNERSGLYCSKDCQRKGRPYANHRISKVCEKCGKPFTVKRYAASTARYCSKKCRNADRITKKCEWCGNVFYVVPSLANAHTCSDTCRAKRNGFMRRGENAWNWKGGISNRTSKSILLIRQIKGEHGCCEECGSKLELHGHHIKPWAKDIESRHKETNIEVLCSQCHAKKHPEIAPLIVIPKVKTGITKLCDTCGKPYYVPPYRIGQSKFCSRKCGVTGITKHCEICGKPYYVHKYMAIKSKHCGRHCHNIAAAQKQHQIGIIHK